MDGKTIEFPMLNIKFEKIIVHYWSRLYVVMMGLFVFVTYNGSF